MRIPWWSYTTTELVARRLPTRADVFEWGSGGSTVWFIDRGATVTSIEHDERWYERMRGAVTAPSTIRLIAPTPTGSILWRHGPGFFDDYVGAIREWPDESFDLVAIDGAARLECAMAAKPKVRLGGFILVDDFHGPRPAKLREILPGWERTVSHDLKPAEVTGTTALFTRP